MLTPAAARWLTAKNAGFTETTRARAVARPNDDANETDRPLAALPVHAVRSGRGSSFPLAAVY